MNQRPLPSPASFADRGLAALSRVLLTAMLPGLLAPLPVWAQAVPPTPTPAPRTPAPAPERDIPVSGGAGKMGGTKDVEAGGGSAGTFKRKPSKLDPKYDPAEADKSLGRDGAPAEASPRGGPVVPTPVGGGGAADPGGKVAEELKKLDDVVTIKNNFTDIKCRRLPLSAKVTVDFQDAPIEAVTKLISCWMERNFILATQKKGGKITILSPQPVSVYEAYRAFLSALYVNGMSVTKKGMYYHIVDTPDARSSGAPVLGSKAGVPDEDNVVTRLIRLQHIDAKEAETVVTKFKSKTGDIFVYAPTNTLIVTDTGSAIRTILKLVGELDVPLGSEKIFIRPVQHVDATELVEKITSIFGEGGKGGAAPAPGKPGAAPAGAGGDISASKVTLTKAIADERSNQLILITTRSNYLKVDALIRKLDVPIPGEGAIHIHHLENADAEDVANTLSSLASGTSGKASGGAKSKAPAKGGAKSGGGSAALFEGEVKITAHKASNALVIESSLKDYLSLQKVIAELDRRRKQVYVEAVIMEISTSKNRKTQFAGSMGTTFDIGGEEVPLLFGLGGLGVSGLNTSQLQSGGLAAGLQGPLVSVNTGNTGSTSVASGVTLSIPAFGFLIQAIQENSDVNVLSTPHILTLNNEDAEITVGRKVPYRSQTLGGLGGLGGLTGLTGASSALGGLGALGGLSSLAMGGIGGQVQFLDVDLTLKITPQINESDFIKLKIDQTLDEIEAMDPNLGPTTSKRKVTNTVVVRDQQPVVIGGLITDRETTGVAKVPVLGDLPLLGMLFRKSTKLIEKKNLLLIVVPHIIKDPSDLEKMHEDKMEQIRDFAEELATKQKEYDGKVDWRKKKGFLQSVFTAVEKQAEERRQLEKVTFDNQDVDKVGSPDSHDLEYDPAAEAKKAKKGKTDSDDPESEDGVEVLELPDADKKPAKKAEEAPKAETEKPAEDKPAAEAPAEKKPAAKATKPAAKTKTKKKSP